MFDETAQVQAGRSGATTTRGPHRRLADLAAQTTREDGLRAPPTGEGPGDAAEPAGGRAEDTAPRVDASALRAEHAAQGVEDGAPQAERGASLTEDAGPWSATTGSPADRAAPREEGPVPAALRARAGRLVQRWVPAGMAGSHRRPSRRVLVSVAAGVVIALGLAGFVLADEPAAEAPPSLPAAQGMSASDTAQPTSRASPSAGPTASSPAAASSGGRPERLVVSVVGKVREPGLVRLRPGARVADAIESAGGAPQRADLLSVNLARELVDGEQIYVGVSAPPGVPTGADGGAGSGDAASTGDAAGTGDASGDEQTVPLNSADQEALESLPGVGEVTAQRILEWRDEHGEFTAVEQLREVDGIGDKRFAELRDAVSIA